MTGTINNALVFLVNTIFDLYIFVLIVRAILVYTNANYFNPLVQFIVKLTNFSVKPLLRIFPKVKRLELASLVLIVLLETIKFTILIWLIDKQPFAFGLVMLILGDTLKLFILTFFYAIILQAIMTWMQPHSPMNYILYQFTSPIMRPLQRIIPPVGGIDISPIPALIMLQLLIILLVNPLMTAGYMAAINA